MKDKKLVKAVFTLCSGKSIVYTMIAENANTVFQDWKNSKENKNIVCNTIKVLEISKLDKDGEIFEKLGIDISKIDSIQIECYAYKNDKD
jgi:hypothetical protein